MTCRPYLVCYLIFSQGKGFCFRLYTEDAFNLLPASAEPEIRRCSLTSSMLQLKFLGQDLETLDFMDKPDQNSSKFYFSYLEDPAYIGGCTVVSALKTLYILGALDNNKMLTSIGRQMATLPLEAHLARILLASAEHGCIYDALDIISILACSSKLFVDLTDQREASAEARRKFRHSSGDHMTILNAFRAFEEIAAVESKVGRREWCKQHFINERTLREASDIRTQLRTTCERMQLDWRNSRSDSEDPDPLLRSLVHGLVQQSAFLRPDGSYKQTMGQTVGFPSRSW